MVVVSICIILSFCILIVVNSFDSSSSVTDCMLGLKFTILCLKAFLRTPHGVIGTVVLLKMGLRYL